MNPFKSLLRIAYALEDIARQLLRIANSQETLASESENLGFIADKADRRAQEKAAQMLDAPR